MTNRAFSKTDVIDILHSNVAEVTFDKQNGEERIMTCTLMESFVSPYLRKTERQKKQNESTIAAFDLNKKEWRSFRVDSIKAIVYPRQWR